MDKSWIKAVLIAAFVITIIFVYVSSYRALDDAPETLIDVKSPTPPAFIQRLSVPATPTPQDVEAYHKSAQEAVAIDKVAVDTYSTQVSAYKLEVDARITAAGTNSRDTSRRLNSYEKVVKYRLATIILAPLLAALLVYSSIKVGGDLAATLLAGVHTEVKAP